MYHTILVPMDGSSFGERALPMATTLARAMNARLVVVCAASASVFPGVDPTEAQCRAMEEAENYLAEITTRLAGQGLQAEVAVPYAEAAEGILLEIELHRARPGGDVYTWSLRPGTVDLRLGSRRSPGP